VDEDDVLPCELLAAGSGAPDEVAVVDDEFEIELRRLGTCVARAVRRVLDAAESLAKPEVTLLDRVEQHRGVQLAVEGVPKSGVPLELVDPQDGLEVLDDIAGDLRRPRLRRTRAGS
jgi:hypothetical protein